MTTVENEEDLTRKQRREKARTERKAIEEASASDAARRKRLTRLGGVVTVVVAAVVVILIATSGGSTGGQKPGTKGAEKVEKEVTSLLAGIQQSGNALGSPTAPVTLQYFGDLECSVCRRFTLGALPSLIQHQVREGKLRIEYHNLETATREPETFKTQQAAALAAGQQAKLWNFIETFYHEQEAEGSGYVTEKYLHDIAAQVPGLDTGQMDQRTHQARIRQRRRIRRPSRQRRRLHRHPLLPDRTHRRSRQAPLRIGIRLARRIEWFRRGDRKAAEGLIRRR